MTTTNLTYSLVSENIRRDKAARGVQGGRGWGPPRGHPPQLLRGVAAENLPVDNSKKKEEEEKKKEWRRITGEEDDIKSPAAALLEGRSQEEWHRMLVQMW